MRHAPYCLLLIVWMLSAPSACAQKRVALVIGNSAYEHSAKLTNPLNDATDMTAVLKMLGFDVIDGLDLGKTAFERKVRDFSVALRGASVGLFFYAGHGLQVAGNNYLVPIDARAETVDALDWEMVRLDLVQRTMERATQTNIIFLDACRNNPLSRNLARAMGTRSTEIGRGLAAIESGVGTLVAFSTQPGNVALDGQGRNSPFAGSLVGRIAMSRDDLSSILIDVRNDVRNETQNAQVPWEHSALTGRFYFREDRPNTSPSQSATQLSEAAQMWSFIRDSDDIRAIEAFRKQYGATNPLFDRLAEARLERLREASVRSPSPPPIGDKALPARAKSPTDGYAIDRQSSIVGPIISTRSIRVDASQPDPSIESCASLCSGTTGCAAFDINVIHGKCALYSAIERKGPLGGYISGVRVAP